MSSFHSVIARCSPCGSQCGNHGYSRNGAESAEFESQLFSFRAGLSLPAVSRCCPLRALRLCESLKSLPGWSIPSAIYLAQHRRCALRAALRIAPERSEHSLQRKMPIAEKSERLDLFPVRALRHI